MDQGRPEQPASRRAIALVALSAIAPGSAQYLVGNRKVGVIALRCWAVLIATGLVLGLCLLLWQGPTLAVLLSPAAIVIAKVLVWLVFLGWLVLLVDAWRLSYPPRLPRKLRLALSIGCLVAILTAGVGASLAASALTAASNVSTVFAGGGDEEANAGRYNFLLLGVDASEDRTGIRPDSINVASVDIETGTTVIFGLPRNLQNVPFPDDSPLHDLYPDGFTCPDNECLLNAVYTLGEANAELFDDEASAGLTATKQAVSATLGLDINYYAMVDMGGFAALIDAMGGVTLDIGKDVPVGGGSTPISRYIEAGDGVLLNGQDALWFARSRAESSDYERMVRQKCVINAMATQLDPLTAATNFVGLSEAGKDILSTDVPTSEITELAQLAVKAKDQPIESVNFTPPLIAPADPDFELIRSTVSDYLAAAESADEGPSTTEPSATTSASATPSEQPSQPTTVASPSASPSATESETEISVSAEEICRAA